MNIESAQYVQNEFGDNESVTLVVSGKTYSVPLVVGNRHYDAFQEWLAEGNTPDPAE